MPPAASRAFETEKAGHTGIGYYAWRGPDHFSTPGNGILEYKFNADQGGVYEMDIRNRRYKGGRTIADDQENDVWVRVDGGSWNKVYSNTPFDQRDWSTRFDFGNGNRENAVYDLTQIVHVSEISGRSANFKLDRINLHISGFPNKTAPESPRAD